LGDLEPLSQQDLQLVVLGFQQEHPQQVGYCQLTLSSPAMRIPPQVAVDRGGKGPELDIVQEPDRLIHGETPLMLFCNNTSLRGFRRLVKSRGYRCLIQFLTHKVLRIIC
jgi:hypothetical protein